MRICICANIQAKKLILNQNPNSNDIRKNNVQVHTEKCFHICVVCVSALCRAARLYTVVCIADGEGVCIVDFHGAGAPLSNYALDYLSYREYDQYYVVVYCFVDCGKTDGW